MSTQFLKCLGIVDEKGKIDFISFFERFGVLIFFQAQNKAFLSQRNIYNVLTEVSIFGIMAVGMTSVILTAGIDLSVGSILAVTTMFAAYIIKGGNAITIEPGSWVG
ncbi:hypothetical protein [Rodentibacter myodis]|uniref:hypothetical protein n=1 Tax=Rodentibacter myodis TaxID=1907939 RepID=UPI001FC9DC56|nr:hypothetical protein [Rodentibacter myodis]